MNSAVETLLQGRGAKMNDTAAQSRKAKALGRRGQRHRATSDFLGDAGQGNMATSVKDDVAVNLITDDDEIFRDGEGSQLLELLTREYPARRIVRIAQEKQLHIAFKSFSKRVEIDDEVLPVITHRICRDEAPGVADRVAEGRIDRGLHGNGLARVAESNCRGKQGLNEVIDDERVCRIDVPVEF